MNTTENLIRIFKEYREKRDSFNRKELTKELVELKNKNIKNHESLLKTTVENLKKHGFEVFLAKDQKEANDIFNKLIKDTDVVIKSKTNVGKEIDLNKNLRARNIEVRESDLGDWLTEVCEVKEIHPVLPAVELEKEFIVKKIKEKYNEDVPVVTEAIAQFAKEKIHDRIMKSNIGITGANVVTASGEIVLLENEGNISKVSRLPEHHIVITGIEKIVETLSEAMHVVKCSAVWGTGQDWPAYVSVIAGPSKTADIQNELIVGAQGAQKATVILLDNGRTAMLEKYADLWRCINCGSCLNFCPAYYQLVEKFGYKYLGAKGILWTAFNESLETAKDNGLYDCTTCEACWKSCPADINLPEYIRDLRGDVIKAGYETDGNKEMMEHVREHGNPFGEIADGEIPKKLYCC